MFNRAFWKDAAERAMATAAQAVVLVVGAEQLNVFTVDFGEVAGFGLGGAFLSLLKSVIASRLNDPQSASLVDLPGKHAAPEV